jgi:hypothetical protein
LFRLFNEMRFLNPFARAYVMQLCQYFDPTSAERLDLLVLFFVRGRGVGVGEGARVSCLILEFIGRSIAKRRELFGAWCRQCIIAIM